MKEVTPDIVFAVHYAAAYLLIKLPPAFLDILDRDEGVRGRVLSPVVYKKDPVEYLHRLVRVHSRGDLGNKAQVPVYESAEAQVVGDRPSARAPAGEERE